ncbi:MAG: insulinase family protein [Alphaproteobacteria bacterium]|nr:insulinase family protein [Alphaproteobacteria bacterium]
MTVKISELPGGLRVVTDRMEAVETVSLGVWVGIGTRHEAAEVNGISHLLEHMAFKGTGRRSAQAIASEIDAVGGHLNAYTSRENTAYYAKMLKDDAALGLDIIADILQNSVFDPEELERERAVVLQEIGQSHDQPEERVFDNFQSTAYHDQPVGRPVLGRPEVIRAISRDAVIDYMRTGYLAPRMVVAASGKIEHDWFVEQAARHFDKLVSGAMPAPMPGRYTGGDFREESDLEQAHLVLGFEGLSYADPDYYAGQVLSTLYGGGMSSRLFQEVREKRGLVYSIYSFASPMTDGGIFGIYAGTSGSQAQEVIDISCHELKALGQSVEADELARARAQLKASVLMARESTGARAEQTAQQMLVFGRPVTPGELVAKIDAVDAAAVSRVARRVAASTITFSAVGPVGGIEPIEAIAARLR